ncbi:MAG: DUF981 family protein [Candidatus Micrarchaeia archaeon]|jgi:putative membrane protein
MFVDPLAVMLLGVSASAAFLAYAVFGLAKGKRNLAILAPVMFALGAFDFLSGFYLSFFWPLPGAYNMLFGDPMLILGIIMLAGAYALHENFDVRPISLLGFLLGIYLFAESYGMVAFGLEKGVYLLPALSFFLLSAISAILSPVVYLSPKGSGKALYYLLGVVLVLVVIAALFVGLSSIIGHLQAPP